MKKAAFVLGGNYGRGFMLCRHASGSGWSAPGGVKVEGGSAGFQIGGSETDVVMLVLNKRGVEKLLSDKFTLGADASVAAGPVGRTTSANTDVKLHAEILSYSRSRGVFAGISLDGATLLPDNRCNLITRNWNFYFFTRISGSSRTGWRSSWCSRQPATAELPAPAA
jgi:SH3 domain-containing YSC84-like protein 1